MKKFLIVFGVGLCLVNGSAYGDYPSAEKIFAHLIDEKGDVSTRFKRLFYEVRSEAKERLNSGQPDPRKMVGEEKGLIALAKYPESSDAVAFPNNQIFPDKTVLTDTETSEVMLSDTSLSDITFSEKREGEKKTKGCKKKRGKKRKKKKWNPLYLAGDKRCWLRRYFVDGDFLIKIDGLTVQKSEDIDELTQCEKYRSEFAITLKEGRWKNEWHAKLADIFKTLASEAFAERLLGKATVDAFCTQTKNSRASLVRTCVSRVHQRFPSA